MPVPVFAAGEVLTAANMNRVGLWKISTTSATSGANFSVDSVFTADFVNYRLVFSEITGTGVTGLKLQWRAGAATIALANYYGRRQEFSYAAGTASGASNAAATAHDISAIISGNTTSPSSLIVDVFAPQKNNRNTSIVAQGIDAQTGGGGAMSYTGFYNAQTAIDGFNLNAGAQTFTNVKVVVYGYRD